MISGLRSPSPAPSSSVLMPFSAHPVCSQVALPLLPQTRENSFASFVIHVSILAVVPTQMLTGGHDFTDHHPFLNSAPSPISSFVVLAFGTPHTPMSQYNTGERGEAEKSPLSHSAEQSPAHWSLLQLLALQTRPCDPALSGGPFKCFPRGVYPSEGPCCSPRAQK